MITDSPLLQVTAIYNFKASNNDELCLKKGDVITVTQALEGGWWEGTLNGMTGWFPSNYVKELKIDMPKHDHNHVQSIEVPLLLNINDVKMYRTVVFQDIVDTEKNYLQELQLLLCNFLHPLKHSEILTAVEYTCLVNNLEEVCCCSKLLLQDLQSGPPDIQRIGGEFLRASHLMKNVHLYYSSNHPKAAAVVEKHKDILGKFMEDRGASPPGIMTLITGLSKPFRRLEKYTMLLTELLRHTQENHVDRGDTQRAASLYRDIANTCTKARKHKEVQLEITSGNIKNWEGEPIETLGNIKHMGPVAILSENQVRKSHYLVVFSEVLVILSSKSGVFTFEEKLSIASTNIRLLEEEEGLQHAFEISGNYPQRYVVICPSAASLKKFLDNLDGQIVRNSSANSSMHSTSARSSTSAMRTSISPVSSTQALPKALPQSPRSTSPEDRTSRIAAAARQMTKKVWPNWNLRPHPPIRASFTSAEKQPVKLRRSNSCKKEREHESEGDIPTRQMLETLNNFERSRSAGPSNTSSAPPRLNYVEDKILIDSSDEEVHEKSLVDTIYMLKKEVKSMNQQIKTMQQTIVNSEAARVKMETILTDLYNALPKDSNLLLPPPPPPTDS